jgi:hypothetical protein
LEPPFGSLLVLRWPAIEPARDLSRVERPKIFTSTGAGKDAAGAQSRFLVVSTLTLQVPV